MSRIPLPPTFSGTSADADEIELWIRRFRNAMKILAWSPEEAMAQFENSLSGPAARWQYDMSLASTDSWSIEQWLDALRKKYGPKSSHSVIGLAALTPDLGETITEFNQRFRQYVAKIPSDMATPEQLKSLYLARLATMNENLWWRVSGSHESHTEIMKAVELAETKRDNILRVARDARMAPPSTVAVSSTEVKPTTSSSDIEKLTDEIAKLKIMLSEKVASPRTLTCFNCGEKGHIVSQCPKPADIALQEARRQEMRERRSRTKGGVMLCQDVTPTPKVMAGVAVKRPRTESLVERILDNSLPPAPPPPIAPRLGVRVREKREKRKVVVPAGRIALVEKLLTSPAAISWKELFQIRPQLLGPTIQRLRQLKKDRSRTVLINQMAGVEEEDGSEADSSDSDSEDEETDPVMETTWNRGQREPLTYILGYIKDQPIPLFLDSGADFSVVSRSFLHKMRLQALALADPVKLNPVSGPPIVISSLASIPIHFDDDVEVIVKFAVMDDCAVPILLGQDFIQGKKGSRSLIDYDNELFTLRHRGKTLELQLCSKRQLREQFGQDIVDDEGYSILRAVELSYATDTVVAPDAPAVGKVLVLQDTQIESAVSEVEAPLADNEGAAFHGLLNEYKELFVESLTEVPGIKDSSCVIDVPPEVKPISCRLRRHSPEEKEAIRTEVDTMLSSGVIVPSKSPWVFPVVLIPKPDGSIRFCIDYRRLNDVTTKDKFPLPRIDDCLDTLANKKYFTTLDCFAGYWQVKMDPESRKFTAFITPFGVYEFTVMPFGLTNAPACFSRLMDRMFADCAYDFVTVYLDDIAVHSETFEQHMVHLKTVFDRLKQYDVRLKFKKCSFLKTTFRYLGFLVTPTGLLPDPRKVDTLLQMKAPTNLRETRSFLGLASYFRRFIPSFTEVASPLQNLVRKQVSFVWSDVCQASFTQLRERLVSAPVLKQPDFAHVFVLSTDASNSAVGGVLEQYDDDDQLRPVAYYSRSLSPAERNYTVHDREALALVTLIKHFRCYLLGRRFIVYTDNSAVVSLYKQREPTGRVARWIHMLAEFDFDIRHRAGKDNPVADYLSRPVLIAKATVPSLEDRITFEEILAFLDKETLPASGVTQRFRRTVRRFVVIDSVLYRRTATHPLRVLFTLAELHRLLTVVHDQTGHFALGTIWPWLRCRFWRPQLYAEVKHYVASCHSCQTFTIRRPLYRFDGQSGISGLGHWHFDFAGPFPISESGSRYLLVGVEVLTAFPIAIPVASETAAIVCRVMGENFAIFGYPLSVTTDRGTCFTSELFADFCGQSGIIHHLNVAYQPEWNGFAERMIATIRYSLARSCNGDYSKWDQFLPAILYGIRMRVNVRTGYSPHFLMFGTTPRIPVETGDPQSKPSVDARLAELDILPGVRHQQCRESKSTPRNATFPVGSFVLALNASLRKRAVRDKKVPRYDGPYRVLEQLPHNLYSVESESGQEWTFHASRLISFVPRYASSSLKEGSVDTSSRSALSRPALTYMERCQATA